MLIQGVINGVLAEAILMKKKAPRSTSHYLVDPTDVDYGRLRDNLVMLGSLHAIEKQVDTNKFRQANYK